MKQTSITIFAFLFIFSLNAQVRWQDMILDTDKSFQEITESFESQSTNKTYAKGRGLKQYQRWKNFWENRLMPDGSFPDMRSYYQNLLTQNNNKGNESGNWLPLGPFDHETTSSWSSGTGRVNVVRQDPNNSDVLYVGAPAGGIWKSDDNGQSWIPLSDQLAALGISDIAIDPSNSQIIYLGTGDRDGGNTYSIGLVKSIDGGQVWEVIGPDMGMINKVCIDPSNPDILWVAGKNGLFKSTDQGNSWETKMSGSVEEFSFKPNESNYLYAVSGHDFYYSVDQGETFASANGLPETCGRMVVAVSQADANVVYVLSADQSYGYQGLFRSNDSGVSFEMKNNSADIFNGSTQAWYDMAMAVSDSDPNMVVTGVLNLWQSTDGGVSFNQLNSGSSPSSAAYTHSDIHFLQFENNILMCGSDGGVYRSLDNGQSFEDLSSGLSIGQFYSIAGTDQDNTLAGGLQDNGSYVRKDNVWKNFTGADGMASEIDPENSDHIFSMIQYGSLYISNNGGTSVNSVSRPGEAGRWETPMAMDPNGGRILAGYNDLFEYEFDSGWNQLSTFSFPEQLSELAIFNLDANIIYASSGQKLFKTEDNGYSWVDVSGNWVGNITSISIHPMDQYTIWITIGGLSNGIKVMKSNDGGFLWNNLSGNLPNFPTHVVKYDPSTQGIYIGNDIGVYYLGNEEDNWISFDNNLPNAIVNDIEINSSEEIIQIATFGRGIWQSELYGVDVKANDVKIQELIYPTNEVCGALNQLEFLVKNVGSEVVSTFKVDYTFSNGMIGEYAWEGSLGIGQVALVSIDDFTTEAAVNEVLINLKSPNNVLDEDRSDNEMLVNYNVNVSGTLGVFHFQTDCFAAENSWKLFDENNLTVAESLEGELVNNSVIEYEMCIEPGCYTLTIYDTYGDGVSGSSTSCMNDGNYNFSIDGTLEFEMDVADFGNSVSHNFCVLPNSSLQWTNIPADIEIDCDTDPSTDLTGMASASTDCEESVIIIVDYQDHVSANQLSRMWTASDACGTEINHVQLISLLDSESPVIECGPDMEIVNDDANVFVDVVSPTVTDNCGLISITNDYNHNVSASDNYYHGTTNVNWTAVDIAGNEATCMQQIIVWSSIIAGLESLPNESIDLRVFPNPNKGDLLFLQFPKSEIIIDGVIIRDLTGRNIFEQTDHFKSHPEILEIYLPSKMAGGLYFIDVQTSAGIISHKLVIKK